MDTTFGCFLTNGSESHEAVTATSRELMLQAKEVAEDMGFTVLHMYVDCLFVQQEGFERASDFTPLLDAILTQTGIPIALEGVYKWLAFLSSKRDARVPVPNQYFGAFEDGTLKFRGIELRRRDTTLWVRKIQLVVLEILAKADTAQELAECLPDVLNLVARAKRDLKGGRVHLEELVVTQKLSRELDGQLFTIVGLVDTSRAGQLANANLYIPLADARALANIAPQVRSVFDIRPDDANLLFLKTDQRRVEEVASRVKTILGDKAIVSSGQSFAAELGALFALIDRFGLLVGLIAFLFATALLLRVIAASVWERRREVAVMRALLLWDFGATSYQTVLGVDVNQPTIGPARASQWVVAGRFLQLNDTRMAVVDKHYAAFFGLKPDDEVKIGGEPFQIVGIVEAQEGGQAAAANFYIPLADAQMLSHLKTDAINQIYVRVAQASTVDEVVRQSRATLGEVSATTEQSIVQVMGGIALVSQRFAGVSSVVALLGGLALTGLALYASVSERRREIGVMKAVGWMASEVQRYFGHGSQARKTGLQILDDYVTL